MRDLSLTTWMKRRPSRARRLPIPFALFAALLCAAGTAGAQEEVELSGVTRPPLNVRPFEDVALRAKVLAEQGRLGRETVLDVTATAELNRDGSLKSETVKMAWVVGADDALLTSLAQQLVVAVGESRILGVLEGARAVRLGFKLDRLKVSVLVEAEMTSAEKAGLYAEGYGMMRRLGAEAKRGTREGALYGWLGFTSDGKMFKMTFEGPRDEVTRIVADALERSAAKRAAAQSSQ